MSSLSVTAPTAPVTPTSARAPARAADGDLATAGKGRAAVKDADGDYKSAQAVSAAPITAASTSTSAVQSALADLKKGG